MTQQDVVPIHGVAVMSTLVDHLMGFREELERSGYSLVRSGAHLELFADLCSWAEHEGVVPAELTSDRVAVFLADRRRRGHTDLISVVGAAPLIAYLVRTGVIPEQVPIVPDGPGRAILEHYRHYLVVERGLASRGVDRYVTLASRFVATLERDGTIDWEGVSAKDVTRYVVKTSPVEHSRHAPEIVAVLRSFLRFAARRRHRPAT